VAVCIGDAKIVGAGPLFCVCFLLFFFFLSSSSIVIHSVPFVLCCCCCVIFCVNCLYHNLKRHVISEMIGAGKPKHHELFALVLLLAYLLACWLVSLIVYFESFVLFSFRSLSQPARHLGFMLEHQYSLSNAKPEYLRGRDAVLYAMFANRDADRDRGNDEARLSVRLEIVTVTAEREFENTELLVGHVLLIC